MQKRNGHVKVVFEQMEQTSTQRGLCRGRAARSGTNLLMKSAIFSGGRGLWLLLAKRIRRVRLVVLEIERVQE